MTTDAQAAGTYDDWFQELGRWLERYLAGAPELEYLRDSLQEDLCEVASELLVAHVLGEWDLEPHEVDRVWFLGRALGCRRTELLGDEVLGRGLPGRQEMPVDPPGRFVRDIVLSGGAHGPGRGAAGKREFPAHWDEDALIEHCMDVARSPVGAVELPNGSFRAVAERDGVLIGVVVLHAGRLRTAYPISGQGVVQNPPSAEQAPWIAALEALLATVPGPPDVEPRCSLDELAAVGEWPHAVSGLLAMDLPWTGEQRDLLQDLAEVSGVDLPEGFVSRSG